MLGSTVTAGPRCPGAADVAAQAAKADRRSLVRERAHDRLLHPDVWQPAVAQRDLRKKRRAGWGGKSTLVRLVADRLTADGIPVLAARSGLGYQLSATDSCAPRAASLSARSFSALPAWPFTQNHST